MFSIIERELPFDDDDDELERARVFVGAEPWGTFEPLDARDKVRAYAARINAAWQDFFDVDFAPWLAARMAGSGGTKLGFNVPTPPGVPTWNDPVVMGDVVGGTAAERAYVAKVQNDRAAFLYYRDTIAKFEPVTGPSATAAWQGLIIHENALKDDRANFAAVTKRQLKTKDPGPLEEPGGVARPDSSIPWGGFVTAVTVVGVAIGISSVARIFRG